MIVESMLLIANDLSKLQIVFLPNFELCRSESIANFGCGREILVD